jgi:Putative MetA-pathway of phenol degradation
VIRRCLEFAALVIVGLLIEAAGVEAQPQTLAPSPVVRQTLDDAWWTGPMLAPSAATLPRGHFLIEPYLYDVIASHSNGFGSLTYLNYGVADRVTVGLIPTAGFNRVSNGPSSSRVGVGDLTLQAQYRLTRVHAGSGLPTISVAVQETLPTGTYNRLGDRPSDGLGNGAYTTTLALYSQTYFWLPNGRILRMRLNVSRSLSNNVNVEDVSVYGTEAGFRGHAKPGSAFLIDASWEYSLTRRWVLALDATYSHNGNTRATGYVPVSNDAQNSVGVRLDSGSRDGFALAPAIEYSWKPSLGVLLGIRLIPATHNIHATITPAVALNFVH